MGWEHKVRNLYLKWTSNAVFCNTGQNVVHASSKSQWSKLWKLADNIWSVAVKDLTICSRLIRQRFHITLRVISEVYHEYCIKVMKVYLAHNSVWCWPLYGTLYIHVFMMRSFCYYIHSIKITYIDMRMIHKSTLLTTNNIHENIVHRLNLKTIARLRIFVKFRDYFFVFLFTAQPSPDEECTLYRSESR